MDNLERWLQARCPECVRVERMLASVAELSLERRVVVVLRYGVGMTPKQIADALDLPVGTVNSRLARSLEQLRESAEVERVD